MDSTDEDTAAGRDPERIEPRFQLARAFVVIGNAGDATRILNILVEHPREFDGQGFGFATTGSGEQHAVTD